MSNDDSNWTRRNVLRSGSAALAGTVALAGVASASPALSEGGSYVVADNVYTENRGLAVFEDPEATDIKEWLQPGETFVVDEVTTNDNGTYVAYCRLGYGFGWIGAENDKSVNRLG